LRRHHVVIVTTGSEALALLRRERFDVVISDVMMPQPAGLDAYEQLAREGSELVGRFVFVTAGAYGVRERAFLAKVPNQRLGKPVDPIELDRAIALVIEQHEGMRLSPAG
jgi:CheY-like chemotaxis protein